MPAHQLGVEQALLPSGIEQQNEEEEEEVVVVCVFNRNLRTRNFINLWVVTLSPKITVTDIVSIREYRTGMGRLKVC